MIEVKGVTKSFDDFPAPLEPTIPYIQPSAI